MKLGKDIFLVICPSMASIEGQLMKRKHLLFIAIGVLATAIIFCLYLSTRNSSTAYEKTLIAYLEALKEGTDKAIEYTSFPNEIIEYDYLQSPMRITDYEVVSSNQVNENLCAFTLYIAVSNRPEEYTPLYYFVGHQDGAYTVYINAAYVPESLHENFNAADYSYSDPAYLEGVPQFDD